MNPDLFADSSFTSAEYVARYPRSRPSLSS